MSEIERAALIGALPYARRYARALTGTQARGDAIVADALRKALAAPRLAAGVIGARVALYAAIGELAEATTDEGPAHHALTRQQRMLLLLTSLEELDTAHAAVAIGMPVAEATLQLDAARAYIHAGAVARVLIIEDEPIIAMDLQQLVENAGHQVVGIASSEDEAVAIAEAERPTLVLADVNLGSGGDGASAVARILSRQRAPVIFVTAYPERLLTGRDVEPAFIITKPFEPTTLAVATYQAVTRGVHLDPV